MRLEIIMNKNLRTITVSAITAAVIFLVTWTIRIPVPATAGGYVNFGDVVIYISAFMLGGPTAAIAAAVGSALADTAAGAVIYIPATFVIKGLMGLICGYISSSKKFSMYAVSAIVGGAVMTAGYGLYELAVFGAEYAASSLPFNMIQWAGSAAAAIVLFPVIKRLSNAIRIGGTART
jgi:uncharacterized membrane protein